jgi:hypothetical protein
LDPDPCPGCRWVANGDNVVLLGSLVNSQQQMTLELLLAQYSKPKLLIVDELGCVPISSNRPVEEWDEVFGDQVVAAAILDRLLQHSHVVTIRGDRYRLRGNNQNSPNDQTTQPITKTMGKYRITRLLGQGGTTPRTAPPQAPGVAEVSVSLDTACAVQGCRSS